MSSSLLLLRLLGERGGRYEKNVRRDGDLGVSQHVAAAETCRIPTPLKIFLNDGHRVVLGGIDWWGRALEIELRRLGIAAVVRPNLEPGETGIHVVILPHDARDWDMARKTLGAVKRPPDGSWSPVFIFFPAIEQYWDHPRREGLSCRVPLAPSG